MKTGQCYVKYIKLLTCSLFVHLNGLHDHLGVPFENELQKLLLLVHLFVLHS
ncbi:unnamed protein product [Schistosoma mattheei]|uniref:Uncharacterized protein n=1 Tax=Schistosoma mattheei TaxID=31246 RepID=A0A183NMI9_9TREM|nr:unnamed protein product [Schistosoma mattheei]